MKVKLFERRKRMSSQEKNSEAAEELEESADGEVSEENTENSADESKEAVSSDKKDEPADDDSSEKEIEKLKAKLAEEDEKYKRLDAEYYNYRMRSIKEKQDAASEASAKTVGEILAVIDNFERALAAETSDETYKKGVEMIYREFTDILKKLGVEEIEALNAPFDPNVHHAVNQIEDENFGENTVCQVYQKGYRLGSKVIRCAMVVVANP